MKLIPVIRNNRAIVVEQRTGCEVENIIITSVDRGMESAIFNVQILVNIEDIKKLESGNNLNCDIKRLTDMVSL